MLQQLSNLARARPVHICNSKFYLSDRGDIDFTDNIYILKDFG